jgi:hypothetical protein
MYVSNKYGNIAFVSLSSLSLSSEKKKKNKFSRARGVVLTILGDACAYLMGQRTLNVYENGKMKEIQYDGNRSVEDIVSYINSL